MSSLWEKRAWENEQKSIIKDFFLSCNDCGKSANDGKMGRFWQFDGDEEFADVNKEEPSYLLYFTFVMKNLLTSINRGNYRFILKLRWRVCWRPWKGAVFILFCNRDEDFTDDKRRRVLYNANWDEEFADVNKNVNKRGRFSSWRVRWRRWQGAFFDDYD